MNNWICKCGYEKNAGKYCENCGQKRMEESGPKSENHNHPSGDCSPSKEGCILTRRIRQAAEMRGIHLNDHIIIGRNQFYSFREHEML